MSTERLQQEREWRERGGRSPKPFGVFDWVMGVRPFIRAVASLGLPALLGLALALAAWEAWIEVRNIKPYIMPAPSAVFVRLYEDPKFFALEGLKTLEGALLGFGLGTGVALALAVIMSQARLLERTIFPLAILVKVTPIVAIAPLLTIW